MDCFYHGCYYKNADGTNRIVASGENCLLRMKKCFWKVPCDIRSGLKTRSRAKSELTVSFQAADSITKKGQENN